jgi:hypothetical protein
MRRSVAAASPRHLAFTNSFSSFIISCSAWLFEPTLFWSAYLSFV